MKNDKVLDFCIKNSLFEQGSILMCCVSGGADSMCLLHYFHSHMEEIGLAGVCCCHLNHGLRGTESDEDELFVEEFCYKNRIPYVSENAHMSDKELPSGMGTEEYARELRYDFFNRAAVIFNADRIATGHTMNDECETVLFRLARGTGLKGAAGIPVKRGMYIRPLLCLKREETEAYCHEYGIIYREDSSNAEDDYSRNRVRHHVVPALETVAGDAAGSISEFASDAGEAYKYLAARASELLDTAAVDGRYDTSVMRQADQIIQKYALLAMLEQAGIETDRNMVDRCLTVLSRGGRTQLKGKSIFVCRNDSCYIDCLPYFDTEQIEVVDGSNVLPSGRGVNLRVEHREDDEVHRKLSKAVFVSALDYDTINGAVQLRHWKKGDCFTSARRHCTKSLKDIFNEKHYTNRQKANVLLLCDDDGVIWLEGDGPSERSRVTEDTVNILRIELKEGT